MNLTQAQAVNTLLNWMAGTTTATGTVPTDEDARESLGVLADAANKRLMAGWSGQAVRAYRPGVMGR